MKRMVFLAAAVIGVGLSHNAVAADVAMRAPYAPAPVVANNWNGLYVGGHFGIGWSHDDSAQFSTNWPDAGPCCRGHNFELNDTGVLAGGQIGYNWQFAPAWVLGIEADLSGTSLSRSGSSALFFNNGVLVGANEGVEVSKAIKTLGSVRGRIGYGWSNYLLYFTGGAAWADVRYAAGSHAGANVFGTDFIFPAASFDHTSTGAVIGGGLEVLVTNNWTARVEYLHYELDGTGVTAASIPASTNSSRYTWSSFSVDALRFGANFKF